MRIFILADPLDNQGAGIHYYTKNLIEALVELDDKAEYSFIRQKRDKQFPSEKQVIVRNYRLPGYAALRMFFLIPWKLKRLGADIVVEPAHFGPFNLGRKIKRVTVIHDLTPILFPGLHRFHSQLLQRIFLKGILKRADLIITNSKNTSKDVINFLASGGDKTLNIYLGKDENIKFTDQIVDNSLQQSGKQYFLFAGTIEPRKNLECLLDAFSIFKDQSGSEHQLVIAGQKGWKSKAFFNRLKSHKYRQDIILTGYVPRESMASLYSHAVAFIFPSLYEGFGLPIVEAMSCGTPCLLSRTSSHPEVGGEAALYFDLPEASELARLMDKIASNEVLRSELSDRSLKQAEKFSWKMHAYEFDNAIKKLCRS